MYVYTYIHDMYIWPAHEQAATQALPDEIETRKAIVAALKARHFEGKALLGSKRVLLCRFS
jgi:hypothetical protein